MNERQKPALHLPKSPLIFVLGQVRIEPVLNMEAKIPAIQDSLRKDGLPRLSLREIEITKREPGGKTEVETRKQWEFLDKEKRASVLIDTDFIVYQVTEYKVFEDFIDRFKQILDLFNDHAEPVLVQRIGLRYIDLIVPSHERRLGDYLSRSLRGFTVQEGEARLAFRSESVTQTDHHSRFVHRYSEASRGFGFPEDLHPVSLQFKRNLNLDSPFGLLDMDHFCHLDEDFQVDGVVNHLWSLHDYHAKAFEASVTTTAMKEWRSE